MADGLFGLSWSERRDEPLFIATRRPPPPSNPPSNPLPESRRDQEEGGELDSPEDVRHICGSRRDLKEGGDAGPSSQPRRDQEQGGGAGMESWTSFASIVSQRRSYGQCLCGNEGVRWLGLGALIPYPPVHPCLHIPLTLSLISHTVSVDVKASCKNQEKNGKSARNKKTKTLSPTNRLTN